MSLLYVGSTFCEGGAAGTVSDFPHDGQKRERCCTTAPQNGHVEFKICHRLNICWLVARYTRTFKHNPHCEMMIIAANTTDHSRKGIDRTYAVAEQAKQMEDRWSFARAEKLNTWNWTLVKLQRMRCSKLRSIDKQNVTKSTQCNLSLASSLC